MNQEQIREKLARAVGGEQRFAESFNARTMFDTRKRAARELDDGASTCAATIEQIQRALEREGLADLAAFDAAEFVDRFVRKWSAYQHAGARTLNWMVTGPAKFPTNTNRKRMDTEQRRLGELVEFYRGAPAAEIRKAKRARAEAVGPAGLALGELADLQQRLAKREANQERMRTINALIRKHKLAAGDGARLSELAKAAGQDMNPNLCGMILQPSYGKPGFASYQLSNNTAEIRRLKDRITQVEAKAARIEAAPDQPAELEAGGIRLVENAAIDRVQLLFPGKPSDEIRTRLKRSGFRWSPREGAWQRQLTPRGVNEARLMLEQLAPALAT